MAEKNEADSFFETIRKDPLKVAKIFFEGSHKTNKTFLEREFEPVYTAQTVEEVNSAIIEAIGRVESLDIFRSAVAVQELGEENRTVNVRVLLKEKPTIYGNPGVDFVNLDNVEASGSLVYRNIFGNAEKAVASFSRGIHNSTEMSLSLNKPRFPRNGLFFQRDTSMFMSGFSRSLNRSISSSYIENSRGVRFGIEDDEHMHRFEYEGDLRDILPERHDKGLQGYNGPSRRIVREATKPSLKSSLKYTYTLDERDDSATPTQGHFAKLSAELAGLGGDVRFGKFEAFGQHNISLDETLRISKKHKVALGLSLRSGYLHPLMERDGRRQTRISDRFFLGGVSSVRGFLQNQLGPKDNHDSVGGDIYYSAGTSLSFQLPFEWCRERGIRGQIFGNAGNCKLKGDGDLKTAVMDMGKNTRFSVGAGIIVPIGGCRLELMYAKPFRQSERERTQRFQIGASFEFL